MLNGVIVLVRRDWRRLAATVFILLVAAGGYALVAPRWYETQLTVVPAGGSKNPSAGIAGMLSAADLPIDLNLGSSDADRIQAVLKSRSTSDAVIQKFDLLRLYDVKYIEDARKILWSHCSTKLDKKPATVTLACEDRSPQRAQAITAYFGVVGNEVFRRISASSATEERGFLEKRVADAKKAMDSAALRLKQFQEEHKVIDLSEQSKAVVSALATLKGELLSKELQLSYLNTFSSSDEATAMQLRQQLAVMNNKLRALEGTEDEAQPSPAKGSNTAQQKSNIFFPAMTVPKLRFELERLYREQKVDETIFILLTQRFEMAKVNEARDTSTFVVLDEPALPMRPSRPPRKLAILAIGLLLGVVIGVSWLVLRAGGVAQLSRIASSAGGENGGHRGERGGA